MKLKIAIGLVLVGLVIAGSIQWESDLIFSHKQHAEDVGADCDACHAAAYTSVSGTDDLLPTMETCYDCHDREMACTACHQRDDDPILLPRISDYSPKFNHKVHVENGMNCLTCHQGIEQQVHVNEGIHIMNMDGCMTCHQTPAELDGCYLCHLDTENLVPVNHTESWNQMHGMVSETGANNCQSCHLQSYCVDCHQGENLHNQTHPAEFLSTHAISWQVREMECASCHTRNFCIECHVEVNRVIPVSHVTDQWNGTEHALEARRNSENCSVCHTQGDAVCSSCHF